MRKARVGPTASPASLCTSKPRYQFTDRSSFQSSLQFEDVDNFEKHLKSRSDDIRDIISRLSAKSSTGPSEVSDLQSQLARKLAEEKATLAELNKALSEKQQLDEPLYSIITAAYRFCRSCCDTLQDAARHVSVVGLTLCCTDCAAK